MFPDLAIAVVKREPIATRLKTGAGLAKDSVRGIKHQ